LLRQTGFRRFWTAQTISCVGDQVTVVAPPMAAVLTLGASATEMGFLAAAGTVPNLLFSLYAGALVDRRGRRRATFNAGIRPVGALAGGALGNWLGLRPTLWIAVIGGSASILPLLPSLPRKERNEEPARRLARPHRALVRYRP
jgi:MFS family permease